MVNRVRMVLLAALCLLVVGAALADRPVELTVSQVSIRAPEIKVYLDVLDSSGQAVAGIRPQDLSGTIGREQAEVIGVDSFADSGEGVAYILLIDISRSLRQAQFSRMREALDLLITDMKEKDRAAIVSFGEEARLISDFTANKDELRGKIESLGPKDYKTQLHSALARALELAQRKDEGLPDRRVVVVLTDGKDEGSGLVVDDVMSKIRQVHTPIYAIGYSSLPSGERQQYLEVLHRFARSSGGVYREAGSAALAQISAEMEQAIRRVAVAKLMCANCAADGQSYRLQISLRIRGRELADGVDVAMLPGAALPVPSLGPPAISWWKRVPRWGYAAIALAVIGIGVGAVAVAKRKRKTDGEPADQTVWAGRNSRAGQPRRPELPLRLTLIKGTEAGKSYELRLIDEATIGRSRDSDLVLHSDPEVSSEHCELRLIDGRVVIRDLGSTNGTLVNGVPLQGRCRLESGDTIAIGGNELRVSFEERL